MNAIIQQILLTSLIADFDPCFDAWEAVDYSRAMARDFGVDVAHVDLLQRPLIDCQPCEDECDATAATPVRAWTEHDQFLGYVDCYAPENEDAEPPTLRNPPREEPSFWGGVFTKIADLVSG